MRDFKILNLSSLQIFFSRGQTRQTHNEARARFKNRKARSNTQREKESSSFSLCTHTHTHTRSLATGSATGARVFQKKKDLSVFVFKNSLSATPGRKSLKKDVLASVQTKRVQDRSGETKVGATETTERNREEEIG